MVLMPGPTASELGPSPHAAVFKTPLMGLEDPEVEDVEAAGGGAAAAGNEELPNFQGFLDLLPDPEDPAAGDDVEVLLSICAEDEPAAAAASAPEPRQQEPPPAAPEPPGAAASWPPAAAC